MLNSYQLYTPHHNPTTNNLRRNSLNSTLSLSKYRRNSFSPPTPLILSQQTFEDFNDDYFPTSSTTTTNNNIQSKVIESFSESKHDPSLSFLDGLDLAGNLISSTNDDNLFNDKNLSDLSTPSPVVSSPQSTIQCVRIIRRNDTAPIQTNANPNLRRVVRVIRLSNASRTTEQSSSSSNVYIVRKTDITPSVQINPAVKHVIAKTSMNNNNNNSDENNQLNKFYGSTISIFGIEFTVVSNENTTTDKRASLVQNINDTTIKTNVQTTNKVF
jgi:hypothetical protein